MKLFHGVRVLIPRQQNDSTTFIPAEALAVVDDKSSVVHVQFKDAPILDTTINLNGGGIINGTSLVNMMSLYNHMPVGILAVVYSDTDNVGISPHAVAIEARETLEHVLSEDLEHTSFGRGKKLIEGLNEGLMQVAVVEKRQHSSTVRITDQCDQLVYVDILHGTTAPTNLGPHFQGLLGWA